MSKRAVINDQIRNLAGSDANALAAAGRSPSANRVELRQYGDNGLIRYYWEVDLCRNGEMFTKCVHQNLIKKDLSLDKPQLIDLKVPERPSTRVNIKNILTTEKKRIYIYSRIVGLLVSCAWKVWNDSSELVVSFITERDGEFPVEVISAVYDGVEVFEHNM